MNANDIKRRELTVEEKTGVGFVWPAITAEGVTNSDCELLLLASAREANYGTKVGLHFYQNTKSASRPTRTKSFGVDNIHVGPEPDHWK